MKKTLLSILVLGSFSALAQDCSVSLYQLKSSKRFITSTLESKGYNLTDGEARFSIQRGRYFGPKGETVMIMNMFEKGNEDRIASSQRYLSFFSSARKMEKDFLKALPECK